MHPALSVVAPAIAFVGTHLLMSHPLRRSIVRATGEAVFLGIYSLVAAAALTWLVIAYLAAATTPPLWVAGDWTWAIVTTVMLLASVLLMGSLVGNPALPSPGAAVKAPAEARGVYAVTRHPMMWAIALWGACHIAVYPVAKIAGGRPRPRRNGNSRVRNAVEYHCNWQYIALRTARRYGFAGFEPGAG